MREAVSFSVVLKSKIFGLVSTIRLISTTAKKIAQLRKKWHNCKKNSTTAKFYVGSLQEISTTAKKWHNCETKCTTAKKKHNCETHLLQQYIFWQYLTIVLIVLFTFPFLFYLFPRSHATTQQRLSTKLPPADAASHCVSRATSFFYFCYIPLPSGGTARQAQRISK